MTLNQDMRKVKEPEIRQGQFDLQYPVLNVMTVGTEYNAIISIHLLQLF
ncbi:MAG TPA: hypothetical protein VFS97_03090 [Nitrososphaeraceae archaeon]|nr:hypothetical protein [Nitrososphaeraceae archaeon]